MARSNASVSRSRIRSRGWSRAERAARGGRTRSEARTLRKTAAPVSRTAWRGGVHLRRGSTMRTTGFRVVRDPAKATGKPPKQQRPGPPPAVAKSARGETFPLETGNDKVADFMVVLDESDAEMRGQRYAASLLLVQKRRPVAGAILTQEGVKPCETDRETPFWRSWRCARLPSWPALLPWPCPCRSRPRHRASACAPGVHPVRTAATAQRQPAPMEVVRVGEPKPDPKANWRPSKTVPRGL